MTTAVIVLTIYVLLRLFCYMMEMLMRGMPRIVRQVFGLEHWIFIRKYIALPETKKIPSRIITKYFVIL